MPKETRIKTGKIYAHNIFAHVSKMRALWSQVIFPDFFPRSWGAFEKWTFLEMSKIEKCENFRENTHSWILCFMFYDQVLCFMYEHRLGNLLHDFILAIQEGFLATHGLPHHLHIDII